MRPVWLSRRARQPSVALGEVAAAVGVDPECLHADRKPGPPRPVERWRCRDLIFEQAPTKDGLRLMQLEVTGRQWARGLGIPVPDIVHHDPARGVLVSRWLNSVSCCGREPTLAALRLADKIQDSMVPQCGPSPSTWRANRVTIVPRAARLILGGLPVAYYLRQRELYNNLAGRAAAHGDYYRRNVLLREFGELAIIDWEHLSMQPRWTDHVRLWSTLTDHTDRELALTYLHEKVPSDDRWHLSVVVRYLTCRLLGENLAAPSRYRSVDDLAHARRMLKEGEQVARSLER